MPQNNNQGRLLNDGLNTSIFAKLEEVRTPAGTIADMQYPEEVGSENMPNFILITAYGDKPATFQTQVKAQSKRGNLFDIISAGLGGVAGSAVNVVGDIFDFTAFNQRTQSRSQGYNPRRNVRQQSNEGFVSTTRVAGNVARLPQESIALYIPDSVEFGTSLEYDKAETERRSLVGSWYGKTKSWFKKLGDFAIAGGEQNRLLSQGKAKNPNKEVAFKEVTERGFTFEYTFAPKSPRETEMVFNIIRTLRFHAHPTLDGDTSYNVPSEFELQFFTNGRENPYIPRLRRLVLTKCDVTYGDDDGFVTFEDGAPAFITASIGFQEVEPLHRQHIEAGF